MSSILIVDDDSALRDLACRMVQTLGFQALEANNGPEGEALALRHRPCLILMDMMMPGQDGAETCRRLRAHGYTGAITLMSAFQESVGLKRAEGCGANSYLAKPINTQTLKILATHAAHLS